MEIISSDQLGKIRTIPDASRDAKAIYDLLKTAAVGDVISYDDMSQVIRRDVRKARWLIQTATAIAFREHVIVFGAVKNVGLKRLSHNEINELPTATRTKINGAIERELLRQTAVDETALSNDELIKRHANLSAFQAIAHFSKNSSVLVIELAKPKSVLQIGRVMDMFRQEMMPTKCNTTGGPR